MSIINAVFQPFRCPNCDTFFNRTFKLERRLTTFNERVKNIFPRNVNQIRETLFDKLASSAIKHTSQQKLFKNLAKFDFESICVQEKSSKITQTTWIGKHVPISVFTFPQILWKNQFFSTILTLTTSFPRLLQHWKVWRRKAKHKRNFYSLISRQQ